MSALKGPVSGLKETNVDTLWSQFVRIPPLSEWKEKLDRFTAGKEGKLLGDYFIKDDDFKWLNSYRDHGPLWSPTTLVTDVSFQELAKAIVRLCT